MSTEAGKRLLDEALPLAPTAHEGECDDCQSLIREERAEYAAAIAAIEAEAVAAERERIAGYEARLVRVNDAFLTAISTRDAFGNRLTLEWGEPDEYGIYEPMITRHGDDNIVSAERKRIAEAVRGLVIRDDFLEIEGLHEHIDGPCGFRAAVLAIVEAES